jgi:hypothetical protein
MVSVLCSDFAESETLNAVDRLLLKSEADLPDDRRSLFVCAECGDLGCGAITISVKRAVDTIVWSDFGYENNYEESVSRDDYIVGEKSPFQCAGLNRHEVEVGIELRKDAIWAPTLL